LIFWPTKNSGDGVKGCAYFCRKLSPVLSSPEGDPGAVLETMKGLTREAIIAELVKKPHRPWADWKHGKRSLPTRWPPCSSRSI
jgi:hypothetical protein